MSDLNIKIEGADQLAKKYGKRSKELKKVTQTILSKVTLLVERYGKLYSPVKTGRMRASIIPINISEMSASVGPQVVYAPFVHKRIPFMFAAREDARKDAPDIVREEVRKALQ